MTLLKWWACFLGLVIATWTPIVLVAYWLITNDF